jgi:hypothetical protein
MDDGTLSVNPKDFIADDSEKPTYSDKAWAKLADKGVVYRVMEERILLENEFQNEGILSIVQEWQEKIRAAQDAIVGAAVRKANGECGIRLVRNSLWDIVSCKPDPTIPAGEIWEIVDHDLQIPIYYWKDDRGTHSAIYLQDRPAP